MGKLKRIFLSIILLSFIASLCITISSCSQKPEEKKEDVIKIGAILPLTGPIGFFGKYERNALSIALDEINQNGGINGQKIKVVYEDSQNNPRLAVSAMNKLINTEKIPVALTQMSGVSMALAPIADQRKVVLVSLAMHPDLAKKSKYVFRIYESVAQESQAMANFLIKNSFKRIGIIYIEDVWGQEAESSFVKQLHALNNDIVFSEGFSKQTKDFKELIAKLKTKSLDALFIAAYGPGVGILAKQIRESGLTVPLFGNVGMSWDYVLKIAGPALEGAIVVMPKFYAPEYSSLDFVKKYRKRFGTDPNFESAFTYDAFKIIATTMKKYGITSEQIQNGLMRLKTYNGISGTFIFDQYGDTKMDTTVFRKVTGGKLQRIAE